MKHAHAMGPLTDEDIIALPAEHFAPLFALLPRLSAPLPPAPGGLRRDARGHYILELTNASEADDLIHLCITLGVVFPCDWPGFIRAQPFMEQPALIDGFDRLQCCMALTAVVRGDRFCAGSVAHAWHSGVLARLVERLRALG